MQKFSTVRLVLLFVVFTLTAFGASANPVPDQYAIDKAEATSCLLIEKRGPKGCGPVNQGYDACECRPGLMVVPDQYAIDKAKSRECRLAGKPRGKGCGPVGQGYDACECK